MLGRDSSPVCLWAKIAEKLHASAFLDIYTTELCVASQTTTFQLALRLLTSNREGAMIAFTAFSQAKNGSAVVLIKMS